MEAEIDKYINGLESLGLTVNFFGGQCPVQVHATWQNGNHLYFRARSEAWDITIATNENDAIEGDPTKDTVLYYLSSPYPDAGYMPLAEVYTVVLDAIKEADNGKLKER